MGFLTVLNGAGAASAGLHGHQLEGQVARGHPHHGHLDKGRSGLDRELAWHIKSLDCSATKMFTGLPQGSGFYSGQTYPLPPPPPSESDPHQGEQLSLFHMLSFYLTIEKSLFFSFFISRFSSLSPPLLWIIPLKCIGKCLFLHTVIPHRQE